MSDVARAQDITLRGLFARAAKIFAGNVAVVDAAGRYTYAEIDRRARRLAAVFLAHGLGRGDRVAILSETRREYVETYIAAAYAGVTLLTLNIRLHPRELGEVIEAAKPELVIASRELWPKIEASVAAVKHAIGFDELAPRRSFVRRRARPPPAIPTSRLLAPRSPPSRCAPPTSATCCTPAAPPAGRRGR